MLKFFADYVSGEKRRNSAQDLTLRQPSRMSSPGMDRIGPLSQDMSSKGLVSWIGSKKELHLIFNDAAIGHRNGGTLSKRTLSNLWLQPWLSLTSVSIERTLDPNPD